MKKTTFREWIKNIMAGGGVIVFFIMAFEVMIMISPFAFFFYSVFNPIFHWLDSYAVTRWLTHFFLPHIVLPATPILKVIRVSGSVLFVAGILTFLFCALQVYLGKIFKWGIAEKGVYRFIRHPQYTALAIWGVGMAILWPRFIVLATLSVMFILYYLLAKDEEKRMILYYGQDYRSYQAKTGMFLPLRIGKFLASPLRLLKPRALRATLAVGCIPAIVLSTGFLLRSITLNALALESKGRVTLLSIMPEDERLSRNILDTITADEIEFLENGKDYLGYAMPVDYIMQGMIANTGAEHHLYKQHNTVPLIMDWVFHPFEHLRRSPSASMAKTHNVDPAIARRRHCPLGINESNMKCNDCVYRRVIFVEVDNPANVHLSGKNLFALATTRLPVGFIDINSETGEMIKMERVAPKTAWSDVPTPAL